MKKEQKFEEALKRLEEIVEKLETGEAELDKTLQLFEEGVGLVRFCSKKLDEAKKKIEILTKDKNGRLKPKPFEPEDDNAG